MNLQSGSVVINMDIPWNPAVLEQRIGRVHRLGQKRKVRTINFVTSSSIEERILGLLKFKKSLFAGVLDSDGEDLVMVGESRLKKFMESVETMTGNMEKPDPELQGLLEKEAEQDIQASESEDVSEAGNTGYKVKTEGSGKDMNTLHDLLISGAQFLTNLGKTISQPEQQSENAADMIIKDKKSGKAYLKIPIPETDTVKSIFAALGKLFSDTGQINNFK